MRILLTAALLMLVLNGCSSPKTTFYTLHAEPIPQALAGAKNTRVMVGPVSLPEMIDQPQMVILGSDNQVQVYEYDRWAGSLKSEIGRVIASNLAKDIGTSNVWNFAQSTQTNFDYQVLVDVQNLQSKQGDSVVVDVLWTIKPALAKNQSAEKAPSQNAAPKSANLMGRSLVREPVTGTGVDALVSAQTRAFVKVSQEIARSVPN
ncbi:membrane integrity-associated transporter subunit PqiC [Polynucleobacter sp. MG-27-Goln-C1]|uniref:PqiC family protein n=1 Tax=Polynucleobacter sp. MG-27-Goln-C1 TaxID=1819726 RepID=UPI001C0CB4BA|nr:PqiC family protein [Polynucleobacter sp. MG-27-Goln-C1]MBU3612146.1 membrane integrity-associated transporter subunit PqiC [Polynucleobacter sp. MG-27-Goln-C1]